MGHAVDGSVKGYLDLVTAHKVTTNGVPKVMGLYTKFQTGYRGALAVAQYDLNQKPDVSLLDQASDLIAVVTEAMKGVKK